MFPELEFEVPDAPKPAVPKDAAGWIERISRQDMPAFGATVNGVRCVTDDESASAARLAQVILQDAAMTAKVLKLANSAFFNTSRQGISTISRAIVVLGFNAVADMALGVTLVDALATSGVKRRVVAQMARSFHAAVQARSMATAMGDNRAEEIFIAALLSHVGEMAFWCFGDEPARQLDEELDKPGATLEECQQRVLGFRLRQLTVGLVREWHLGPMVQAVAEGNPRGGRPEDLVLLAHKLSMCVENGWDTRETRAVVKQLAAHSSRQERDLLPKLMQQAEEAARIAASYGANDAARMIPLGSGAMLDEAELEPEPEPETHQADPVLQLRILRELSGMIASRAPLNDVLHLAMEGLYRTLGLDRALFALLAGNRTQLIGKAALGKGAEQLSQAFVFTVAAGPEGDPVRSAIEQGQPLRLAARDALGGKASRFRRVLGEHAFCLVPILAAGRPIGVFYGDCEADQIDDDAFDGMLHFAQQASMAVTQVAVSAPPRRG